MALAVPLMTKRFFNKNARDMTLRIYTQSGTSDYDRPTYTATDYSLSGVLSFARRSRVVETENEGRQLIIEAEIYFLKNDLDDAGVSFDEPLDPSDKRNKIIVDNASYNVHEVEHPTGFDIVRFVAWKERD